jgi:hypothetical protein
MYQQLWGYKVEEKLNLGVREQKRLNTTAINSCFHIIPLLRIFTLNVSENHITGLYMAVCLSVAFCITLLQQCEFKSVLEHSNATIRTELQF